MYTFPPTIGVFRPTLVYIALMVGEFTNCVFTIELGHLKLEIYNVGNLILSSGVFSFNVNQASRFSSLALSSANVSVLTTSLKLPSTLETFILSAQMALKEAFRVAIGMSLISMISMEAAMNIVDLVLTGGAKLTWWVIIPMLIAGFLTPWPYNYWRLKKHGVSCH